MISLRDPLDGTVRQAQLCSRCNRIHPKECAEGLSHQIAGASDHGRRAKKDYCPCSCWRWYDRLPRL